MVFILHRYIFREVFKVFALATVALTLMMSLGSILRPVQEFGVGPSQVIDLMAYFLPVTLTFVLPMAALFAAALVYGRLANDNELDACRASGISLLSLIYPGLALAVIVATANLLLSFYVMPVFVQRAESAIKNDARQILFRNIQRKGYYSLPPDDRYRIYADDADVKNNLLSGVVAAEIGDNAVIKKIITAETAKVAINPHDKFNEVRITAHNTHTMSPDENSGFSAEWLSLTAEFGALLGDKIAFKKIDEMKHIRLDPMLFDPVAKLARRVYAQFTAELLAQKINAAIASKQTFRLNSDRIVVELTAKTCSVRDEKRLQLSDDVVIVEIPLRGDGQRRTLRCQRTFIEIDGDELAPTLILDIRNAKWTSAGAIEPQASQGAESAISRYLIRGLVLPPSVTNQFKSDDILKEINPQTISAALPAGPSAYLSGIQHNLQKRIALTLAQINSETHSRLVFGIGCITIIMIGIALGIVLKGGHLLTAFAASAVPALALITCIMMGKNVAENSQVTISGIWMMWAGLIVLSVLALVLYRQMLRH
jgi:lipopolysaccharide export LptBFGC system permease protein LptF